MPIRAENKDKYPKNWRAIVAEIRERSGGRCECTGQCGREHIMVEDRQCDIPKNSPLAGVRIPLRCAAVDRKPHPATGSMVVLTTAHMDHKPQNVRRKNLLHFCQACHLRYDAPMKAKGIRERNRIAKGDLFGGKE